MIDIQHISYCKHKLWVEDGRVWLANDDDPYYKEDFINHKEIEELINQLRIAADKAWPHD
jgi:hypothetical protein